MTLIAKLVSWLESSGHYAMTLKIVSGGKADQTERERGERERGERERGERKRREGEEEERGRREREKREGEEKGGGGGLAAT